MNNTKKGTHLPGQHVVVDRNGLKVGEACAAPGTEYSTLTAARKACKSGQAVLCAATGKVVSVK